MLGAIIYCFGLPVAAVGLISRWRKSRDNSDISRAEREERYERVSLLVSSYEDEFWYMEAVWMLHKFYFTGVIHLIAPSSALQVWAGAFGCVIFFTLTLQLQPYKSYVLDWLQLSALLQLLLTYMTMFLFQLDGGTRTPVDDPVAWGLILVRLQALSACRTHALPTPPSLCTISAIMARCCVYARTGGHQLHSLWLAGCLHVEWISP